MFEIVTCQAHTCHWKMCDVNNLQMNTLMQQTVSFHNQYPNANTTKADTLRIRIKQSIDHTSLDLAMHIIQLFHNVTSMSCFLL